MNKYLSKALYILLFLLTVFIFFLNRSAELLSGNFVFVLDQGRDMVAVADIVTHHKLTLIGSEIGGGYAGITGIFQGPLHYYFLSIFYLLFHGDPYGGIVYMMSFAIFSLVAIFFVSRVIFKKTIIALIISLLFAISPPLVAQAKFLWNPHPITFFLILDFLFVYLSFKKSKVYIFLAGFLTTITYNFEIASTVPLSLAVIAYYIFLLRLKNIKAYALLVLGMVLGMFPFFLFEVRHNFIAVHGFLTYISSSHTDKKYALINNHFDRFLYNVGDTFSTNIFIPLILFGIFLFGCFGYLLWHEKRQELKSFMVFLVFIVISTIFVLSFLRNFIMMYYLFQLNVVYILMFGYCIYATLVTKKRIILILFTLLLGIFTAHALIFGFRDFKNDYFDYGGVNKIKGKKDAVDYIYKDAGGKKFGLYVFAPGVLTPQYDYIVNWYGGSKYGYVPTQSKKGTFYLLMEPDNNNKWAMKGWQDTVIKSGNVQETITLPSGLVVQKRFGK